MKSEAFSFRRLLGEILLTAGLLIVLFVFYEAFWTNVKSGQLQAQANERMEQRWQETGGGVPGDGVAEPDNGQAFSRIYIPRLGAEYEYAVLAGTSQDVLAAGPGHYVDTQGPGEIGNFAIAGHRIGQGAPFVHLEDLHACDAIVVETATQWITYRVLPLDGVHGGDVPAEAECFHEEQRAKLAGEYSGIAGRHITHPGDVGVIAPIPGVDLSQEGAPVASESMVTLTTCHPWFSNSHRMIVHAMEVEALDKASGQRPVALDEAV